MSLWKKLEQLLRVRAITRWLRGLQLTTCWRFCVLTIMPEYRTKTANILVATDSIRTVHGGRGDYLEFSPDMMVMKNLDLVHGWCPIHRSKHRYFFEYWTADGVRVYEQRELVNYADYKIGYFYIAPELLQ
jgi:hypothetical protein